MQKEKNAPHRNNRLEEEVKREAARFLSEHSTGKSLITVTRAHLSDDAHRITIFLSIFPDTLEKEALDFAKRKRGELHTHLQKDSRLSRVPFIDFIIDRGEKNRQALDKVSGEK